MTSINDTFKHIDPIEYEKHLEQEKLFYNEGHYDEKLLHSSSPGLQYLYKRLQQRVKKRIGVNIWNYTVSVVNKKGAADPTKTVRVLSFGSGPGGPELTFARKFKVNYTMECIDINKKLLEQGQRKADSEGLNLKFIQKDINKIKLPNDTYDVVFVHSALHHLINLEYIADQIKNSMKDDAQFIVFDVITRNGMKMWDETKPIVNRLLKLLPPQYRRVRINGKEKYLDSLSEKDTSEKSMECIRSEEVYSILKNRFKTFYEIPGYSFARRFADHPFRKNYDPKNNPFDKAILDMIIRLDEEYTVTHNLKPESIILVLKK